jgi:hypothetical protein
MEGQTFHLTGFLAQPPTFLRTAVSGLEAQYEVDGHKLEGAIRNVLLDKPRLRKKYSRPDPNSDRLYRTGVAHPDLANTLISCEECCGSDSTKLIHRPPREEGDCLVIHCGLVASANTLMKDAFMRDKLAAERDVLCFEMEAAGLMNQLPCWLFVVSVITRIHIRISNGEDTQQ